MTRALAFALALALAGCASTGPMASKPPPAAPADPQSSKPGSSFFWVQGNWAWDEDKKDYHWKPGRWESFRDGWYLAPGAWTSVEGGWQWQQEQWKQGSH
jgi:hypothetical protein